MISQANRRPGHATWLSAIRSKPFAPVFTCQNYLPMINNYPQSNADYTTYYVTSQEKFVPGLVLKTIPLYALHISRPEQYRRRFSLAINDLRITL